MLEEEAPIMDPLNHPWPHHAPGWAGTCPCWYGDHLAASAIPLAEVEMPPAMGTETTIVQQSGAHTHE